MPNRAAVMTGLGEISIQERPEPTPGPRDAVVRIEAVGVCGSDTAYFKLGRIGDYVVDGPIVLGHEVAGQVEVVGAEVTNVRPGDRVAIEPGTPCRDCEECLAGRYHLCPDLEFLATPPYDGALLQLLLIDARNLFVIPEGMSYEEGALLEPLSVGIWACQRAALAPGDDVLVTGAGPIGLVSAAAARALGAGSVTVTDVSDFRLELARSMGFATERGTRPRTTASTSSSSARPRPACSPRRWAGCARPAAWPSSACPRRTRSRCPWPSSTPRSSRSASSTATRTRGRRPSGSWPRGASTSSR